MEESDVVKISSSSSKASVNTTISQNGVSAINRCRCVNAKRFLEVTIVVSSITVAIVAFSLPVVLHYNVPGATNCSSVPYIKVNRNEKCSPVVYNGSVCRDVMNRWQKCSVESDAVNDDIIQIQSLSSTIEAMEDKISQLLNTSMDKESTSCYKATESLLCQLNFPLCNNSGQLYQVPFEYCSFEFLLLNCSISKNITSYLSQKCFNLPKVKPNFFQPTICPDRFILMNGFCLPLCTKWQQYHNADTLIIITPISCGFGLLCGICFFIASFVRCKQMSVSFPSIYLVFATGAYCIIAITGIVPLFERDAIFCEDNNATVPDSLEQSTIGCKVIGVLYQYFITNVSIWWFYHVCSVSFKIFFPMLTRKHLLMRKIVNVVVLTSGWLIPVPFVYAVLTNEDQYGYVIPSFPPQLCTPRDANFVFYTYTLFTDALLFIGTCLLILDFWLIHKYQGILTLNSDSGKLRLSDAERKILFLFWYYVIFGPVGLVSGSLITGSETSLKISYEEYFACQLLGNNTAIHDQCLKLFDQIDHYTYFVPYAVTMIYLSFFPMVNLIFVINWKGARKKILSIYNHCCRYRDYEEIPEEWIPTTSLSANPTSPMVVASEYSTNN